MSVLDIGQIQTEFRCDFQESDVDIVGGIRYCPETWTSGFHAVGDRPIFPTYWTVMEIEGSEAKAYCAQHKP
jgi:hypothetical protein